MRPRLRAATTSRSSSVRCSRSLLLRSAGSSCGRVRTPLRTRAPTRMPPRNPPERRIRMDWKLELVAVPVSDVDRAKAFYVDQVGFVADQDHDVSDEVRFVQLTPRGSACSIAIGR